MPVVTQVETADFVEPIIAPYPMLPGKEKDASVLLVAAVQQLNATVYGPTMAHMISNARCQ